MPSKRAKPPASPTPPRSGRIPLRAIRKFAREIAEKFHPEKIILFGSQAYGTPHQDSDVDLLVVMPARNMIDQAARIRMALAPRTFPLDLIVRTPAYLRRGLAEENWFLREIVDRGKVLHEARDEKVDSEGGNGLGVSPRPRRDRVPHR